MNDGDWKTCPFCEGDMHPIYKKGDKIGDSDYAWAHSEYVCTICGYIARFLQ